MFVDGDKRKSGKGREPTKKPDKFFLTHPAKRLFMLFEVGNHRVDDRIDILAVLFREFVDLIREQ